MKVVFTGGGTGGHVYPALAIASEFKKRGDEEILFVGTQNGMEAQIVPREGFDIEFIKASGFDRESKLSFIKSGIRLIFSLISAIKILRDFKPDIVVGTGGYVSASVLMAANFLKIPTYIHEQNAVPGLVNRKLSKKAKTAFAGFEAACKLLGNNAYYCGNPVRDEFGLVPKEKARKELDVAADEFVIFAVGGSQGARTINEFLLGALKDFVKRDIRMVVSAGRKSFDEVVSRAEKILDCTFRIEGENGYMSAVCDKIHIFEYIENMPLCMAASDLVIARGGALTVAEICASFKPAIYVPFPFAVGNHQYYNAKAVADVGGGIIMEEKDLTEEKVMSLIDGFRKDTAVLADMGENAGKAVKRNAAKEIVDVIKRSGAS